MPRQLWLIQLKTKYKNQIAMDADACYFVRTQLLNSWFSDDKIKTICNHI